MAYEIAHSESFPLDLGNAPKKVRNAYRNLVIPSLRSSPDKQDAPKIKRLIGYKSLWRIRVSDDYRLVYRVEANNQVVVLLMLGNRKDIYDRLGVGDDGKPGIRIITESDDLLEREPTPEEVGQAEIARAQISQLDSEPNKNLNLPQTLTTEMLEAWGVSKKYHSRILHCKTEGDILFLTKDIPEEVVERILNGIWPPKIEEVVQKPVRVASDPSEIERAADGERSLESFLLRLDNEQKDYLSRFEVDQPKGPWLLKGGPGSGKSTLALYCAKTLLNKVNSQLPFGGREPINILLTTYTKALTNASNHLFSIINSKTQNHKVHVKTVDSLAHQIIPQNFQNLQVANESTSRNLLTAALHECKKTDAKFGFSPSDARFILSEIDWVIIGQDIRSVDEYIEADRTGRGKALGQQQRRQIWRLTETYKRILREKNQCLFSERLQVAAMHVTPRYDYVFIDEAQDLKPVAIRLCIGLCKNRTNVFLTADSNQSIYGSGLSWARVASELRFQGRARILRKNYRTTTEIWEAIKQLAPDNDDVDRETLDVQTVYKGPWPILARYSSQGHQKLLLNEFLHSALRTERVSPASAAILCPTEIEMNQVIQMLDAHFNAKAMKSRDVDIAHSGVKVLTMHAAKGLQFPVVAIVGIESGRMPLPVPEGFSEEEHNARQQRLLFVACSRAMRQLIVFVNKNRPSPFAAKFTEEFWQIKDF